MGGAQPGEVVVGVGGGQAGHLAAPLGAELDTQSLQGSHSSPDEDGAICKYSNSVLAAFLLSFSALEV